MSSEIRTRFVVADTFVARRRVVGGQRQIHVPAVFKGKGFKEIKFGAVISEERRWAGDVIAVFENLREATPFVMVKIHAIGMVEAQKIQGAENLAQVLQTLKAAGADTITVQLVKPHFHPGSRQWGAWGASIQAIRIKAETKEAVFSADHIVEFPESIQTRLVRWLLK